ncbi:MAG: hypothetical protein AB4426_25715 [Xenococcaceae cyanobacterium]
MAVPLVMEHQLNRGRLLKVSGFCGLGLVLFLFLDFFWACLPARTSLSPQPVLLSPIDNPNDCEEEEEECEEFRDFAHGSSLESINNIVTNGIMISAASNYSRGGLVNRPGFYTIDNSTRW